ncbi:MAG: FecR domain-containing protein [Candidatus Peribacteraceae bacterium]|nr:FecR domain-containing protein [Candidatus Peribacteraceae bacterium]
MLIRRHRRPYLVNEHGQRRPALLLRIVSIGVLAVIIWYLGGKMFPFFMSAVGRNASVLLSLKEGANVQFSLQGQGWQAAVPNVKLYPQDGVMTKKGGDAMLTFFDGSLVRLDEGSEVLLEQSEQVSGGTSETTFTLKSGRVWISSPDAATYSGAIKRTIRTTNAEVDLPTDTQAAISESSVSVLSADGLGVGVTLTFEGGDDRVIFIGEGQTFSLTDQSMTAIGNGGDPYDFRDPLTSQTVRDPFIISSFTKTQDIAAAAGTGASDAVVNAGNGDADLTLTSPADNLKTQKKTVTVAGRISERVALLLVNGEEVAPAQDHTFSVSVSLGNGPTSLIKVEAQNAQGLPIQRIERTIQVEEAVIAVEPVRIKSPVGSGDTLTTNQAEIDISGEAPAGTDGVMVNDYRLQLFKPGSRTWSYLASTSLGNLREGSNAFSIYALDADGNKSPARTITIVLTSGTGAAAVTGDAVTTPPLRQNAPLTPGVLSVHEPAPGTSAETGLNEVILAGKTSGDTASISINGYTLSLYEAGKTTWNYIASTALTTMKRGNNVYRIVARNSGGEILDVLEYTLTYKP